MDLYSGAGLENFDGGDLKGVVVVLCPLWLACGKPILG